MMSFLIGVISTMWSIAPGFGLLELILSSLTSPVSRLSGQIEDPNQLGTVAAFFAVFAIVVMYAVSIFLSIRIMKNKEM